MAKRANNEGTIYKKTVTKNGKEYSYWEAQVTVGYNHGTGRRVRKTFTGSTQKEVRAKMQEASVAVENREYFEPSRATMSEWIDRWLDLYSPNVKYQTKKHYRAQCETHIKPAIGAIRLADLSTEHIQQFYKDLETDGKTSMRKNKKTGKTEIVKSPLSPKSIKNIHCILSKCLNVAIKLKYIKYNPASLTQRPKVSRPEISPLTNEQVKALLTALEKENLLDLYKVIVFTGLRKAEALGLTWDCIDFKRKSIKVNKQLQKRPIKDGGYTLAPVKQDRVRILTITQYVSDALDHRKKEQQADIESAGDLWKDFYHSNKKVYLVFTTKDGTPINPKTAYRHYKKIADQLGIPESRVHDLRHTFAVLSLQNGDDYKTLQENLGHASASFTLDVYGHVTTKMQQDAADRMQVYIDSLDSHKDS